MKNFSMLSKSLFVYCRYESKISFVSVYCSISSISMESMKLQVDWLKVSEQQQIARARF